MTSAARTHNVGLQEVKTIPIEDDDLPGVLVLEHSLLETHLLVEDFERLRRAYAKQLGVLSLVLKAFSDLYSELTEKTAERQWQARTIQKAEREAARLRLPAWFWRIDTSADLKPQLQQRAEFMMQELKPHPDDIWDALIEILEYAHLKPNNELVWEVVKNVATRI